MLKTGENWLGIEKKSYKSSKIRKKFYKNLVNNAKNLSKMTKNNVGKLVKIDMNYEKIC